MSKVDAAIPEAGKPDAKRLAAIDPETLAQYVTDRTRPWWRRRPCVEALQGRVPEARVPALLDRIRDPEDTSEVRIALLELLGDRVELLPYLLTVTSSERYGVYEQVLHTRGRLGDLSAAPHLAELAGGIIARGSPRPASSCSSHGTAAQRSSERSGPMSRAARSSIACALGTTAT